MKISVHLMPSNPAAHEPGHRAVSWENDPSQPPIFRGYVFNMLDLPLEYQSPDRWRDYLFTPTVPGQVINDSATEEMARLKVPTLLEQTWPANEAQVTSLAMDGTIRQHGVYSFNPDDHPGAHNCVTWATSVVNRALGEVLPKVRQGRIKLMAELLSQRANAQQSS